MVTEASRKGTNMKVRKRSRADQLRMFPSGHCPNPRAKAPTPHQWQGHWTTHQSKEMNSFFHKQNSTFPLTWGEKTPTNKLQVKHEDAGNSGKAWLAS